MTERKPIADLLTYLRACVQVAEENGRQIAGVDTALTKQAIEEIERLQERVALWHESALLIARYSRTADQADGAQ